LKKITTVQAEINFY